MEQCTNDDIEIFQKEIEAQMKKSLETWCDVMLHSSGCVANMEFTSKDIFNAMKIFLTMCLTVAIKNGKVKSESDGEQLDIAFSKFMQDYYGIDTKALVEAHLQK